MHSFLFPATFRRDAKGRIVVGRAGYGASGRGSCDCVGSVLAFRIAEKSKIPAPSRASSRYISR